CGSGKKYKVCHERLDEEKLMPFIAEGYPLPYKELILTPEQIEGVKKCSRVSVAIMDELDSFIKEGVSTDQINDVVEKVTADFGAESADLGYEGFPKSCCTSINNVVCHGIPNKKDILKDGDIINVDVTTKLNGYFSDMSRMYMIGNVSDEARQLTEVTKKCMDEGIACIKPYMPVGEIGNVINDIADKYNYGVVRALCGHGVGLVFHGDPMVNHYRTDDKTMILVPGMMLTVEPMINAGTYNVKIADDGWTVLTADGSLSAQWEHTLLVTETGVEIITA
ncbi:MAG TPA: methionine aminopeptidase, partial [Lachnospiraceae bacterium]|nr:methionine aminopeptidase [Lachnospiraceae bacterium]